MKKSEKNSWVSLFKIFLCFVVIQTHFTTEMTTLIERAVGAFGAFAVPGFMFVSFYYMGTFFRNPSKEKLILRIKRLYIPVIIWTVVYWGMNAIRCLIGKTGELIGVKSFFAGLLLGHGAGRLPTHLWYLTNQIWIIVVFLLALLWAENKREKTIVVIGLIIVVFFLQYSGTNLYLFGDAIYEVRFSFGRVAECIPFAGMGILYAWYLRDSLVWKKILFVVCTLICTALSVLFVTPIYSFGYGGVKIFFAAITVCGVVFLLPEVIPSGLAKGINAVADCTMGIYCIHLLVGWCLKDWNLAIGQGTLLFTVEIFAICLILVGCYKGMSKFFLLTK